VQRDVVALLTDDLTTVLVASHPDANSFDVICLPPACANRGKFTAASVVAADGAKSVMKTPRSASD
jgi:hypothetical protein